MTQDLRVYLNNMLISRAFVDRFVELAEKAIVARGRFAVALSGGMTPRLAYQLLGSDEYGSLVDWSRIHIFWADERCVPPSHSDSNYGMTKRVLLDFVPIEMCNIYRIHGELEPQQAAEQYEKQLHRFFEQRAGEKAARFDLVLLGLGADGHTASLFPGDPVLREANHWAAATHVEKLDAWRVTLTPLALNGAANVIFMVTGLEKADIVEAVLVGPEKPDLLPAQLIKPERGQVTWLLDSDAASRIEH